MKYCDPEQWNQMHVVRLGLTLEEFKPIVQPGNCRLEIVAWAYSRAKGGTFSFALVP
jgi:hypothetical protein